MELKQLQTFKTLAEKLNFTRTAQLLNYAQSSITAQIQGLEIELGVPLFERLGKRVLLTAAGERLLPYANEILRLADEVQVTVPGDEIPNGTLTIGAIESLTTYRLSPILGEYRRRFPQVELVFRTGICVDLRKEVLNGRLDLAFTLEDVVRTRMYLTHAEDWEIVGRVHGEYFGAIRPAATMIVVAKLLHPTWRIEIEAEAIIASE